MASASVVLTSDTSGSVTVTVPSGTAIGTTTLTLPTSGGTIQTSGSGFTTNGVAYASSTSALTTGTGLVFTGTNLGIGTSSPAYKLDVTGVARITSNNQTDGLLINGNDNNNVKVRLVNSGSGGQDWQMQVGIQGASNSNYVLRCNTTSTNVLFADSSGNVGIGTSSPLAKFDVLSTYVSDATVQARIRDNTGYALNFTGTSSGFKGLQVQDAAGAADYTNLLLNPLGGNLLVGSSSNILSAKFLSQFNGSTSNGAVINDSNNTSASGFMAFSVSSGTYCGNITRVGSTSAVGYNSGSDERLKENIVDAPSSNINDIKVRSFNWKSDNSFQTYGLVAQELLTSAPYCVYQPTNPEDMMGVDNSKLVPMMIKSIQELSTLITAQSATIQSLTERITALEGART